MNIEAVLKKLRYNKTYNSMVVNVPLDLPAFKEQFLDKDGPETDFTILFINNQAEFDDLFMNTIKKTKYDGLFWLAYPKKSSKRQTNVTRDTIWESMKPFGYRPVSMISIDKTWSAMRVRPAFEVKKPFFEQKYAHDSLKEIHRERKYAKI
jgi:hypothetical protein